MSRKSWIEETFCRRECLKFIPSCRDLHRCYPVCQVCQNLIRCCCGRLMGEHSWEDSPPPTSLCPGPGQEEEEIWSMERHTRASPTNAYGTVDFEDSATRVCRAKYVRLAVDSKPEALLQLMLREWQMERPKLLLTVQGGSENFTLPPKVRQAFSKGLLTAALSTGAWILTDGINTGVSKLVGEAVKTYGTHDLRKRNTVGVTPWGLIDNHTDLIGRDVFRPYQPLGNPLSKRACLNSFHSHFLLVDDGTLGKHGCQHGLRRKLEKHIQLQKIHPRLNQGVPVVCVVVEGGPSIVSMVLDYVSSVPPVPVFVFEGSGRAADLLALVHKQTAMERQLEADIQEDFLVRIGSVFGVDRTEASYLYNLLLQCMDHRQSITIFDSESEDQQRADSAILTATLKGTKASPAEQLSMALAWDRADVAKKHVLVYGQHWQVGSLEQAMLDALVMDRVGFVKLLIDYGMTMNRFLSVDRLEELYNTPQGPTDSFLRHLVEDVKQAYLPRGYRLSIIDVGLVIEYLIGGAYRSAYTRKHFRAAYNSLHAQGKDGGRDRSGALSKQRRSTALNLNRSRSPQRPHFFRTAQPYKRRETSASPGNRKETSVAPELGDAPLLVHFNFNDLFVWAVLQRRQQMALFLWQHGEEALARATVACKLYRTMAFEARQSNMDDNTAEQLKTYSLEFGQLAVDVLDYAFRQSEQMAMKLLTSEMVAWSHFTSLQMAVSSGHIPFVSHSCTQTLLTDLWTGSLNMRKNSFLKIILSLLLPPAILLLEFKSQAEMCHIPQAHEAPLFGLDSRKPMTTHDVTGHKGGRDAERGLSCYDRCLGPLSDTVSSLTTQCLFWIRRLYEFYTAPVVKFWFHTMFYIAFLMLFSYTILVKMEDQPSVVEWLVIAYILSTAVEKTREVLMSEPRKLRQKLKVWFSEYWNCNEFIAILLFLAGLTMRWYGDPYRTAGRISYCLDIVFWFVRVLDLLAFNQHAGPYLTIITKMTRNMLSIVVMMVIVLLSFGVSRKAILSPDEELSWTLLRDVAFQPYWMMFGEVYAGEIDACGDGQPCPPGAFLTPFLQAVYLFVQYIIMVNILIAFFNNVYFDMASTSNNLWKYNRYRYIMTYQERPWLPPPLIILSHITLGVSAIYRRHRGEAEQEERCSGLKLYLGPEDLKRLHEFEEKCVQVYFHERNDGVHSSQTNRIRATAERTEEMAMVVGEVSERVNFIQDSLLVLDGQLGQLQDLSAMAVDTLTLLSATDNIQQEEVRLACCQPIRTSPHLLPHSWTLSHGVEGSGDAINERRAAVKPYRSTPPSLLKGHTPVGVRGSRGRRPGHTEEGETGEQEEAPFTTAQHHSETWLGGYRFAPHGSLHQLYGAGVSVNTGGLRDGTPSESCGLSCYCSPPYPWSGDGGLEASQHKPWTCDPYLYPSQEVTSMEEEEEEGEEDKDEEGGEEKKGEKQLSNLDLSRTCSRAVLLADPQEISEGLENPAFCQDDNEPGSRSRHPSQWGRNRKGQRWAFLSRDNPYGQCRSLSSSVENMVLSDAPLSPLRGSFPLLNGPMNSESLPGGRSLRDDASLRCCRSREWSKSSDLSQVMGSRGRCQSKKTVKIQEGCSEAVNMQSHLSDTCWRRRRKIVGGEPACWSASASLNQLNFEPMDLLQKLAFYRQESRSPSQSVWNSLAKSVSCRSSLQSGITPEAKSSSFQSTDNLYPHYSAVERNNLMRLAHTIPFTPVSILAGEEVSIYFLEEASSEPNTESGSGSSSSSSSSSSSTILSSWSSRGLSAMLQPLYSEEGSLDGGLRRGNRVLCTWAEGDVLRPGVVYVVKAFRPEVVHTWQRHFHGSTALQLCLREIQQQRAAQKMMHVFNQVKPENMHHSPRFLDVSLVLWHSDGQWLTIERNMTGDFRKYNNNTGEEIRPWSPLEETLLAFSHWTYEYSCRELLVLDIQGVGEELTDPSIIKAEDNGSNRSGSGEMVFGPDNLGDAAINSFLLKHTCNSCCHRLGLADLRRGSDSSENSREAEPTSQEEGEYTMTRM